MASPLTLDVPVYYNTVIVEEPSAPKLRLPHIEQDSFRPQFSPPHQRSLSMPLPSLDFGDLSSPRAPTHTEQVPSANLFFAEKPSESTTRKRRPASSNIDLKIDEPLEQNIGAAKENDFYAAIQSLVGLAVLKTRFLITSSS